MTVSAPNNVQGVSAYSNDGRRKSLTAEENKISTVVHRSLNNQEISQNINDAIVRPNAPFAGPFRTAFKALERMQRREFVERLEKIKNEYQDDSSINEACTLILKLYGKPDFTSQLLDVVFGETTEDVLKQDIVYILSSIEEGTTALGTAQMMARRCVYYSMPVKESTLVYDEESKEVKRISAEEFESVIKEVREDKQKQIYRAAFDQRYLKPVEKAFSDIKKTFPSRKTILMGVGASLLLGYAVIRR